MAWHADLEWATFADPDNASNDLLPVARRGHLEEGAAKSIRGSGRVRQQRAWTRAGQVAVIPSHRSGCDVSAALAMATLDGPLESILLLVCCEDLRRWPEVLRQAMAALQHPHGREAATDAMHRIMWRRPVEPLHVRAKGLRCRKESYAKLRDSAERLLLVWLELAAERFIRALNL